MMHSIVAGNFVSDFDDNDASTPDAFQAHVSDENKLYLHTGTGIPISQGSRASSKAILASNNSLSSSTRQGVP